MKKSFLLSAVFLTMLCSCGGVDVKPDPQPQPQPDPIPSSVVAGTYDCYFAEDLQDLRNIDVYSEGGTAVFTATGDSTVTATFSGTGFPGGLTERMKIFDDASGYLLSCLDKNTFDYGLYNSAEKSFTFYVKGSSRSKRLAVGAKMAPVLKFSGKYDCKVEEKRDWVKMDVWTFADNTASLYIGYIETNEQNTRHYIRISGVSFSDGGVLSGSGLEATFTPRADGSATTATVSGSITDSNTFNITITLAGGTTYTVKPRLN